MDPLVHPSDEQLRAFASAESAEPKVVVRHLLRGCERCSAFLQSISFLPDYELPPPAQQPWFDAVSIAASLRTRIPSLTHQQRAFLLANAQHAQTPPVVAMLASLSEELVLVEPRESLLLAQLALDVAYKIDATAWRSGPTADACATALIALANAQRVHGDLQTSLTNFSIATSSITNGTGDVLLAATYYSKRASLDLALLGPELALRTLKRARTLLHHAQEITRLRLLQIKESTFYARLGDNARAITLLTSIKTFEPPGSRLHTIATANLARVLADSGAPMAALAELAPLQARGTSLPRQILYPVLWTSARIDRALGSLESAILRMERLQLAFEQDALFRDWLLLSIDLADAYAAAARWPDAIELLGRVQQRLTAWDYPADGIARWAQTNTQLTTRTYAVAAPALAQLAHWQQDAAVPLPPLAS